MEYLLIVVGERRKETGPGSVRLGVEREYETRTHHIEAENDVKARSEGQSVVQGYQDDLALFGWLGIDRIELYRRIGANSEI